MSEADRHRALLACCRPDGDPHGDRRIRLALQHLAGDPGLKETFASQVEFDRHMGERVRAVSIPAAFETEVRAGLHRALRPPASTWRGWLRQPALWAVLLAFTFLAGWAGNLFYERSKSFTGDENVRGLIESALSRANPSGQRLVPIVTDTDKLGDPLFLQYNVDQYEVPGAFARAKTVGFRVFEKNDSPVTQVQLRDHNITLLVFRADAQGVDISPPGTWKLFEGENWHAAAEVHHSLCFVAVCRGEPGPLNAYLQGAVRSN